MSDFIGVDVAGIQRVQALLSQVDSPQVQRKVSRAVADHLRGQMRKYPPQTYVSRAQAYGRTFKTPAQRRWFFWALRSGRLQIPYHRTDRLKGGWRVLQFGGTDHLLLNETPYARFVQNSPQARMMTLRQWRSIQRVIHEEAQAIQRKAQEALNAALKQIR